MPEKSSRNPYAVLVVHYEGSLVSPLSTRLEAERSGAIAAISKAAIHGENNSERMEVGTSAPRAEGSVSSVDGAAHASGRMFDLRGEENRLKREDAKYCIQCGTEGVVTREITPNHVFEMYCPHCGVLAELLWGARRLVGTNMEHDPDSDAEAW